MVWSCSSARHSVDGSAVKRWWLDMDPPDGHGRESRPLIDPAAQIRTIAKELKAFDAELAKRPRWLVFNKADLLPPAEARSRAAALVRKLRWKGPWFVVSAATGEGTREVCYKVMDFLDELRRAEREAAAH
jgi:GTP-binding protein